MNDKDKEELEMQLSLTNPDVNVLEDFIYILKDENANLIEKVQITKLFLKERLSYADDKDELFVNKYCLMALLEELEKE
jgi:hypothetical protein